MSQESLSLFENLEETETSEQAQAPAAVSDVEVEPGDPEHGSLAEGEAVVVAQPKPKRRSNARAMAKGQRAISISEFFTKNRHLLGFDNPSKALLTAVREAVDNALDAAEEAGILPHITVEITPVKGYSDRYRMLVRDLGPGIIKRQIGRIFGKLLYCSHICS